MRIEVSDDRIEGFCSRAGMEETSVIAFNRRNGIWSCGSSMCLPSSIGSALVVNCCVQAAFEALQKKIGD